MRSTSAGGNRLAKTIIFARNNAHAVSIAERLTRTDADLQSLQDLPISSGVADPADRLRSAAAAQGFGRFIRSLIRLDRQAATADQIQFIQLIINYLTRHGGMPPDLLFEPLFTDNAPKGIGSVSTTTGHVR